MCIHSLLCKMCLALQIKGGDTVLSTITQLFWLWSRSLTGFSPGSGCSGQKNPGLLQVELALSRTTRYESLLAESISRAFQWDSTTDCTRVNTARPIARQRHAPRPRFRHLHECLHCPRPHKSSLWDVSPPTQRAVQQSLDDAFDAGRGPLFLPCGSSLPQCHNTCLAGLGSGS